MLAYVFWHQPTGEGARDEYERALVEFHRVLTGDPPAGFLGSATYRLPGVGWAPDGDVYEDWYLVRDSAALDPLNEAAVSGRRGPPSGFRSLWDRATRISSACWNLRSSRAAGRFGGGRWFWVRLRSSASRRRMLPTSFP